MMQSLVEYEEIVFETIQDYLNKNRIFDMKKIIPYLKSKFAKSKKIKINNEGIQKILISLAKKKMVIDGSKFTRKDVLMSSKRKIIYNYIKENPGTYCNKIANEFEMTNFHVYWHLTVLLKFNFIKKTIIDNHPVYYDSNIDLSDAIKFYLISKKISKKIINYLKINSCGIARTKLSIDLKIHYSTLKKYINSLVEFNIISKVKRSNQILYFFEEKLN